MSEAVVLLFSYGTLQLKPVQLANFGRELNAMNQVVGIMFVIVVIGLLSDKILFSPLERFLHRRWGTGQA